MVFVVYECEYESCDVSGVCGELTSDPETRGQAVGKETTDMSIPV